MTNTDMHLVVNGDDVALSVDPQTPLLLALRNDLGLRGARTGCGIGECGVCTVLVDGRPVRACNTPVDAVVGSEVVTPEGLGTPERPHPVQQAFLDEQAAQCGYCINGIIMTVAGTLAATPDVDTAGLRGALADHLCRCGTHVRVLRAAERAAGRPTTPHPQPAMTHATPSRSPRDRGDLPPAILEDPHVSSWLALLSDGRVEVRSGKVELGQGVRTALAQLVAGQLGVAMDRVVVRAAATGTTPDEGYTSGSSSLEQSGSAVTVAAVAFRRLLLERAGRHLHTRPDELTLATDGTVWTDTGACVALATLASQGEVAGKILPGDRPLVPVAPVGDPVPRADLIHKLTGAPAYVQDLQLPGMLHARALLPTNPTARLADVDAEVVTDHSGLVVVRDGSLLMVVAEREEVAAQAVTRLQRRARYDDPPLEPTDASWLDAAGEAHVARRDAGLAANLEEAAQRVRATYGKPYQAHGAMAPSCAVGWERDGALTVYTHSQGIYPLRRELARLCDMDEDAVTVEHRDGPGCYGHNGADDAAAFAALAARAVPGRPVRFQLTAEQEFVWEPYGSAMRADLEAGVDERGALVAWRHRVRTDVHGIRPVGDGERVIPARLRHGGPWPWTGPSEAGARNGLPPYDIPAMDVVAEHVRGPVRTGSLRSLGAFLNVFASESLMDEVADAVGQDPLAFRLAHLRDPRARSVLEAAARTAGWTPHVGPSGRGQGLALARYKGTKAYVAEVVDVRVDTDTGRITVPRVVVACDAGLVVNPDGLRNQIEGGVLQGLSRALHEEIVLAPDGIRSRDWTTYPVLGFDAVPDVEIVLVEPAGCPPLGAGESSTPPLPAALANAIDDAVGIRLRTLPFTPARFEARLLAMDEQEAARVRL